MRLTKGLFGDEWNLHVTVRWYCNSQRLSTGSMEICLTQFQCLSSWPSRRLNCFMSCSLREPRQPGNARALRNQGQWTAFVAKGQCWFLSHACMHGERHVSHVACLQGLVESVCGGATVNRDPQKSKGIGLKSQLSLEYESQLFNHQTRGVFNASLSASSWNLAKKHPWNLDFATAVPSDRAFGNTSELRKKGIRSHEILVGEEGFSFQDISGQCHNPKIQSWN